MTKNIFWKITFILAGTLMTINIGLIYTFFKLVCLL